jgi:hypothetical protein
MVDIYNSFSYEPHAIAFCTHIHSVLFFKLVYLSRDFVAVEKFIKRHSQFKSRFKRIAKINFITEKCINKT